MKYRRPEQSGFTPGRSTTDCILAFRVLVERRREFRKGMLTVFVDFKKAFDSVHCMTLWDLLRLRGIPAGIIGLSINFYFGTGELRVRQGCILAPLLFNTCMDWIMGRAVNKSHCGASVGNTKITDLVFSRRCSNLCWVTGDSGNGSQGGKTFRTFGLLAQVQVFRCLLSETIHSIHACGRKSISWKALHTLVA